MDHELSSHGTDRKASATWVSPRTPHPPYESIRLPQAALGADRLLIGELFSLLRVAQLLQRPPPLCLSGRPFLFRGVTFSFPAFNLKSYVL